MPISSGANRWPKSYWTKPQPRLLTVAERVAERHHLALQRPKPRTFSVADSPSKSDTAGSQKPSPPSDVEMPRPPSPHVVMPLPTAKKQESGNGLAQSHAEKASSKESSVFALKCTGFKQNVSRLLSPISVKILFARTNICNQY